MRRARSYLRTVLLAGALAACGGPGSPRRADETAEPPAARDADFDPVVPASAPSVVRVRPGVLAGLLRDALRGEAGRSPVLHAAESLLGVPPGALASGHWVQDLGLDPEGEVLAAVLAPWGDAARGTVFGTRLVLPTSGIDAAERRLHAVLRERGFVPEAHAEGLDALYRDDGNAGAPALATLAHVGRTVVLDVLASPARPGDGASARAAALARVRAALASLHAPARPGGSGPLTVPDGAAAATQPDAAAAVTARWDFTALAGLNALVLRARAERLGAEGDAGAAAVAERAVRAGEARARDFPAAEFSVRAGEGGGIVAEFLSHGARGLPLPAGQTPAGLSPASPGALLGDASAAWLRAWGSAFTTPEGESPDLGARELPGLALPLADALGALLALPGAAAELARRDLLDQGPRAEPFLAPMAPFERVGVLHPDALRGMDGGAAPAVLVGLLPAGVPARCALATPSQPCARVALVPGRSARALPSSRGWARALNLGGRTVVLASASASALGGDTVVVASTAAPAMHGAIAFPSAWGGVGRVELRGEARAGDWAVTVTLAARREGRGGGSAEVWPRGAGSPIVAVRTHARPAGGTP